MYRFIFMLMALGLTGPLSWAAPAEDASSSAAPERSCAGVANEVSKGRELNRELNVYAGQTVPPELQQRVLRHLAQVALRKAECEQNRDQAVLRK